MPRRPAGVLLLGVGAMAITWIWPILTAAEPEVAKGCVMECTPNRYASRIIPLRFLKSYQNSTCHGTFSVILTTVRERTYCARPGDDWVQKAMRELDAMDAARLSSSGLSTESVTPSQPLSVSTLGNSLLSDSTGDPTSETTLDLTTVAQRKDSTSQLSTRPAADERSGTTMSVKDRNDATKDPTVTIGQHLVSSLPTRGSRDVFPHSPTALPTSDFHQENREEGRRGLEIEKAPGVTLIPASILPEYQTYTISITVVGVVFILLVGIAAWAYFKTHTCARKPRQRIRGLVYSPVDSYANDVPMQNLLVIRGTDFAPCVGASQAWSGKQETDGSFFVFNPLPEDAL